MQLAFFLLPKSETVYLKESFTIRQAMEKMQHHGLGAVTVLNSSGQYVGAITAADFLWYLKDQHDLNVAATEKLYVRDVPRRHDNKPVTIDTDVRELLKLAMVENFIPVIDDLGVFIGIVRRREIMEYYQKYRQASRVVQENAEPGELLKKAEDWLTGTDCGGKS